MKLAPAFIVFACASLGIVIGAPVESESVQVEKGFKFIAEDAPIDAFAGLDKRCNARADSVLDKRCNIVAVYDIAVDEDLATRANES
ncbi:hypothetical protein EVJ58_g1784 [Rhodofomes roseus]|uniref:UrcA family protein n=1 Tax=Rhodofomes roseus TaxID=34475 RepID=A0A4Y9YZZ8_9APHY|nr:hypothetical protein EVJ58_g1784 [Rhodofomes roseus]